MSGSGVVPYAPTHGQVIPVLPLKVMFTAWSNIIKVSIVTAKEIISMGLKDFGDILKEGWPPKVELGRNDCPFT